MIGGPPQLHETNTGDRAESPSAFQDVRSSIDKKVVPVPERLPRKNRGQIFAKVNPGHCHGVHVTVRLHALTDTRGPVARLGDARARRLTGSRRVRVWVVLHERLDGVRRADLVREVDAEARE